MTPRSARRTIALVIFGVVALAACVPVKPAPAPPPPTAPPPPPNPCASVPAQSSSNGTDYVAVTNDDGKVGVHKFHAGTIAERDQQVAELGKNAEVLSVAPDQTVHATDVTDPLAQPSVPNVPNQWGLFASHFTDAWNRTVGTGVRIAVVDSGVQADHEDLAGQVVAGKDFVTPGVTERAHRLLRSRHPRRGHRGGDDQRGRWCGRGAGRQDRVRTRPQLLRERFAVQRRAGSAVGVDPGRPGRWRRAGRQPQPGRVRRRPEPRRGDRERRGPGRRRGRGGRQLRVGWLLVPEHHERTTVSRLRPTRCTTPTPPTTPT